MSLRRIGLVAAILLSLLPAPTATGASPGVSARQPRATRTSVHYEDAQRHAGERIRFKAGGRVTVAFKPRPGDDWTVDGKAPQALPAGRRSGAQIATEGGTVGPDPLPVDSPPSNDVPAPASDGSQSAPPATPGRPGGEPDRALAPGALAWATERVLAAPVSGGGLRREVFGFLPYWELSDSSTGLDYSVLSTIAYFGVGADEDGHLIKRRPDGSRDVGWAGWTSSRLTAVINAAHAKRTRVVLTVQRFAWTTNQIAATKALLGNADARRTLAREIAGAVADRGVDGVNLDFEPIPSGYGDEYVAFVRQVRKALDDRHEGYQLTFDTTGSLGAYDIAALTARGAADAVFIMGYDYRTSGATSAGSIAPLSGPRYDIEETIDAYLARVDPGKVILGVPYYGRAWSTTSDAVNARTRPGSPSYGYSTSVLYGTAVEQAAKHGRRWDATEQTPWIAYRWKACDDCPATWRELYYDDVRSLGLKYDLINARGLRGAGIWALGYDGSRPELYALLRTKFREDSTAPTAGIVVLPATTRDASLRVRWAARDDTAVERYDVQVSVDGGGWSTWQNETTRTAATMAVRDGHGYAFRVRARDRKGHWSPWNVADRWQAGTGRLKVGAFAQATAGLAMRARPDTSARSLGRLSRGARLRIVGGPRSADGATWLKVIGPLKEWGPVSGSTRSGAWVAARQGSASRLAVVPAPNTTRIDVLIDDLAIGAVDTVKAMRSTSAGKPSALPPAFSPGRDGTRDGLRVTYRLDARLDRLSLVVLRASDGAKVGSRPLPGRSRGRHAFDWDGKVDGRRLADGSYLVQLVGARGGTAAAAPAPAMTDPTFDARRWTATIDTSPPVMSDVAAVPDAISPDGDGRQERAALEATGGPDTVTWSVRVLNARGAVIRTMSGRGRAAATTWDGKDERGRRVADGSYRVEVRGTDALGNDALAARQVVVDTADPRGDLVADVPGLVAGASASAFSPDGDGWQDVIDLRPAADEAVSVSVVVRDRSGRRRWSGSAPMAPHPTVRWRGRDKAGAILPDGRYRVVATVTDAAGNRSTLSGAIRIDRTASTLRADPPRFYPQDGDRLARTSELTFRLRGRATTTLRVRDASGGVMRTAWKDRVRPAGRLAWTWDGRDGRGVMVAPGSYQVELVATARGVTQIIRRSVLLDAFAITPATTTPTAGSRLRLDIRATERLRAAPRVTIRQPGVADRTVTTKRLADGRYRVDVRLAAGIRGPARFIVRAKDAGGRTDSTTLAVAVR